MVKQESIKLKGYVEDSLPNAQFRVRSEDGLLILTTLAGKMKKNHIKISIGDAVDIEVSPYDLRKGRIVYRHKRQDLCENF